MRSMFLKRMDDRGQSNIDFLFGLGIFLVTFVYAATFIPGLFVPYQSGAIDLSSVAYRTGAILVEDPGWYMYNDTAGLPNWEDNIPQLARIGLADNSIDRTTPNQLSIDKINAFNNAALINYTWARDRIGLNGSMIYDFNAYLTMNDTLTKQQYVLLSRTSPNTSHVNVESIERPVMVDMGPQLFVDCNNSKDTTGGPLSPILWVDISDFTTDDRQKDLTIRIYNVTSFYGPINMTTIYTSSRPGTPGLNDISAYTSVNVSGRNSPIGYAYFTSSDIVEVTINHAALQGNANAIEIPVTYNVFPPDIIQYHNDQFYSVNNVYYPGIFRLEVWSHGLAQ
jgi:hypothetical protein